MSTLTTTYSNNHADGYFSNLGRAARAFIGALVAAKPVDAAAQQDAANAAEDQRHVRPSRRDIALLNAEATQYEKLMPNLAAELRFLASRG